MAWTLSHWVWSGYSHSRSPDLLTIVTNMGMGDRQDLFLFIIFLSFWNKWMNEGWKRLLKMQLCHHLIETPREAEGSKLQDVKKCLIRGREFRDLLTKILLLIFIVWISHGLEVSLLSAIVCLWWYNNGVIKWDIKITSLLAISQTYMLINQ